MSNSRRLVLGALALVVLVAAVVALVPRFRTEPARVTDAAPASGGKSDDKSDGGPANEPSLPTTPTSEELIAAALEAGDLTYEASLRARAYALFNDPRLEPAFRSTVIDWEAWAPLLAEIDAKESTLSESLLADLRPFRVRPNHPESIVNRPRAEVLKAQLSPVALWEGRLVQGTRVKLWSKGPLARRAAYERLIQRVWSVLDRFFPHPLPDDGTPASDVNPDDAVDVYLVNVNALDPRSPNCDPPPTDPEDLENCAVSGREDRGAAPDRYVIVKSTLRLDDFVDTVAHELAHVRQQQYDRNEALWFAEGTATWVGYKVSKRLRIVPLWEYEWLKYRNKPPDPAEFFRNLDKRLTGQEKRYGSWIFFYYASMERGDNVVKQMWEVAAATPGADGIRAVNQVLPLENHFYRFSLRNWNQETVPTKYETQDDTFAEQNITPLRVEEKPFKAPGTHEIGQVLAPMSAVYYRFTFAQTIRKVVYQSLAFSIPQGSARPHVWALKKIDTTWKDPEDWTDDGERTLCRDLPDEAVTELILIVSNGHLDERLPIQPKLRVLGEDVGCADLTGWARATLRLRDDTQDVTYVSSRASLRFRARTMQDPVVGNIEYDLLPTAVTWTVTGTRYDCKVTGQSLVNIPSYLDQPVDPTRPAYGHMTVVSPRNGDFHNVVVSAANPGSFATATCPGDPPIVRKEPFHAGWLLHIVSEKNSRGAGAAVYKGKQTLDAGNLLPNMPMTPGNAVTILPSGPGAGAFITPEIQEKLKEAQKMLERMAAENKGKVVYTFEWELKPM